MNKSFQAPIHAIVAAMPRTLVVSQDRGAVVLVCAVAVYKGTVMSELISKRKREIKILDPNYKEKIQNSFSVQGFMQAHKGELVAVEPGFVEVHLPFSKALAQQHGFFHGGIIATAADSASGFASYTVTEPDEECLSAEFKINFLSPGRGDKLIARGNVLRAGRNLIITEATVSVLRDGEEIDCALMIHTLSRTKQVKTIGK